TTLISVRARVPLPPSLHSFPTRRSSDLNSKAKLDRQTGRRHPQSRVVDLSYCVPTVDDYAVKPTGCFRRFVCQTDQLQPYWPQRSEEHTSELQSRFDLVCRLLLERKNYT